MRSSFRWTMALFVAALAARVHAATEITVAIHSNIEEAVKAAIPAFEKAHPDVKVKLVPRAFGAHNKVLKDALESGSDLPDVVGIETGFLQTFSATGALEDLAAQPYQARPLLPQVLGFAVPLATPGQHIWAIPSDVGPGTLFYRKDVLDNAGVTEEELTRSWDSYIEAGKKVKAATGAYLFPDVQTLKDIYIRNGLKEGEGIFFDAKGEPVVDSPRFQQAFALARKAREAGVDGNVEMWTQVWVNHLDTGTIATQPLGSWFGWHLEEWLSPKTSGQWRVAQLPNGAFATWGGDYLAIPSKAAHKTEGWEFIEFLCFDKGQQVLAFQKSGMWPALKAAQDDPFIDEAVSYFGEQKARQLWKVAASRMPTLVVTDRDGAAARAVYKALKRVLEKGEDIDKALAEAKKELKK